MSAGAKFLPGDRVAWFSPYNTAVYSGTVEVVATYVEGDRARVLVDGHGLTVVECDRLSLIPDARPVGITAAVEGALSLLWMLAAVREALADDDADRTAALESVEDGLSKLLPGAVTSIDEQDVPEWSAR